MQQFAIVQNKNVQIISLKKQFAKPKKYPEHQFGKKLFGTTTFKWKTDLQVGILIPKGMYHFTNPAVFCYHCSKCL